MNTYGITCFVTFFNLVMAVLSYPYQRLTEKHIIDMNPETHPSLRYEALKIEVDIGEFMEITCPQYDPATPKSETFRFYLLDMHDGESFELCNIEDKQVVLSCDTPFSPTKLTMKFQKISPYPYGFTFKEGTAYYYTAIPVGEDDCKNAMKLVVNVRRQDIFNPPISTLETKKKSAKPTPPASTSTTTTTTKTKFTPKSVVTPKGVQLTTTSGASNPTQITQMLPLIALLTYFGSWMNW